MASVRGFEGGQRFLSSCRVVPWWQSDDMWPGCRPPCRCLTETFAGMWLLTAKEAERGRPAGCGMHVDQLLPAEKARPK